MKKQLIIILMGLSHFSTFGQSSKETVNSKVIFTDDFKEKLDPKNWTVELDSLPNSSVFVKDKKIVLDTKGGVTVWLNKKLSGDIKISYKRKVIVDDGQNDRLSDLNQFWLAEDPNDRKLFTRNGKFEEYDSLRLFYVGMGGNYNSTTRFRKYDGNGQKIILHEKNEKEYLLRANQTYQITIIIKHGETSFWVDNERYFIYSDHKLPQSGYFGFRSTFSRQEIWDFDIEKL
ncbi:MAG: DUF6250 domain-containing protein [Arcicella sp.]|nr:DUF6250 domain-containing protein [Arcicella sp.]